MKFCLSTNVAPFAFVSCAVCNYILVRHIALTNNIKFKKNWNKINKTGTEILTYSF